SIDWTLLCSMENTTMKWENTSMKALSGTLCYYTLTPVVKYNCIMFLRKYKTTHKYTVTTKIFLYFFQKCCSLYITANTNECVTVFLDCLHTKTGTVGMLCTPTMVQQ